MKIKVVVFANKQGEPDAAFYHVQLTKLQFGNGRHYEAAKESARAAGYEGTSVAVDEMDEGAQYINWADDLVELTLSADK